MKKLLALLLCLTILCLAGCGGQNDTPTESDETPAPSASTPAQQDTTPSTDVPVDLQALYEACKAQMPEMIDLDADMMLDYCGIQAEDCVSAYVAICSDGLLTDEIWILEAVDEAARQNLLDMADSRLEAKAEESQTYSPEQYAVVQKAQVITHGNYVAVLVSPDVDTLKSIVNDALGIQ